MRRSGGFSLVEALVVVALVSILAGITVPLVADGMKLFTINSAGQQVSSTIRGARFQAVARNTALEVQFDPDAGTYQVFEDGGAEAVGEVRLLPDGVSFDGDPANVEITTAGRVTTAVTVTVTNGNADQDRTITVSTSGRVQLQ